jgi:hypothetical protein
MKTAQEQFQKCAESGQNTLTEVGSAKAELKAMTSTISP